MQRIMIIGGPGSGKSTLARALGAALDLPVVHGGRFYYRPGWEKRDSVETNRLFTEAAAGEAWVLDGNHKRSRDFRAERADLIIYMHLHRIRRMARCLWRSARHHGRTRPDMAPGCNERFDFDFFLPFVWNYDKTSGAKAREFLDQWRGKRPILELGDLRAVNRLIRDPKGELARRGLTRPQGKE